MCKIKFVEVSQIIDPETNKAIGMQYLDKWMVVSGFNSVDEAFASFRQLVDTVITDTQSIVLCRDDAKRFCKSIAKTVNDSGSSKVIFHQLKEFLHGNYEVKRIIMNPRTLEYYPLNKAFIIHKL